MADPVQILEEVLAKGCGAVKFFGKINSYSFAQKERAEKVFLDALKEIASRNGEQAEKASTLLDTFDDHINSTPVQRFWEEIRLRNEEAATRRAQLILAEKKKQRVFCIDSDVAEEHIISSHRLLSESKAKGTQFDVPFDEYIDLRFERKRKHSVDNIPSDEEDGENSVKEVTKNHFEFGKTSPEPEEPAGSSEANVIYRASTPSGVVPASGTMPPFSVASTNITDEIATGTDEEEFNNEHRALFVHAYGELLDEHKWCLRSGRVVEDVMFEKGLKFRYVSNIHSFCYVAGDPNITGLFTPEEREEIEAEPKSIQPFIANGTFHKFYNKFASCETANDLRKLLYGTSHEELLSDGALQGESWHCQMYHAFLTDMTDASIVSVRTYRRHGYWQTHSMCFN